MLLVVVVEGAYRFFTDCQVKIGMRIFSQLLAMQQNRTLNIGAFPAKSMVMADELRFPVQGLSQLHLQRRSTCL